MTRTDAPQQINPPFDGSPPCPMCQEEVRGLAALFHNTFVRWGEQKMYVKLNDIREFHSTPLAALAVPHPAVEAMVDLHRDLLVALEGLTRGTGRDACKLTWTPAVSERVGFLHGRFRQVLIDLEPLSEAHFADDRHSCGRENVLRPRRGGKGDLYDTGHGYTEYDYSVDAVEAGTGDLAHVVCGTELRIHDHYKSRLAQDPAFFGKVWCPTCRIDAPIAQFATAQDKAA